MMHSISYRDIQQYLSDYYEKTKKTASLYDAVSGLYQQHKFYSPIDTKQPILQGVQNQLTNSLLNLNLNILPMLTKLSTSNKANAESIFEFNKKDAQIMMQFQHEKGSMHYHDYFEINIVLEGKMLFTCQNETKVLDSGSVIVISPLTQHKIQIIDNSIVICLAIKKDPFSDNFYSLLKTDNLLSHFLNSNFYSSNYNFLLLHTQISDVILRTLKNIADEAYFDNLYSNEICCNYISILFFYILQNLSSSPIVFDKSILLSNKIVPIIHCIKSNSNSVNLDLLSQKFGYDKAYLGKLIKQNTGHSFSYLRNYHRIKNSRRLLEYTDKNIEKISIEVGYTSPNHFERCFRQLMNTSPLKYRKNFLTKKAKSN